MSSTTLPSTGLRLERRAAVTTVTTVNTAPRGPVRLTGRGRAVLVLALALLLFAAFSLGRTGAEGSTEAGAPAGVEVEVTTVAPGETLWSVAKRIAPGQDPRPVVDQIVRLNDLPSAGLRAGQQLLLPVPA